MSMPPLSEEKRLQFASWSHQLILAAVTPYPDSLSDISISPASSKRLARNRETSAKSDWHMDLKPPHKSAENCHLKSQYANHTHTKADPIIRRIGIRNTREATRRPRYCRDHTRDHLQCSENGVTKVLHYDRIYYEEKSPHYSTQKYLSTVKTALMNPLLLRIFERP